MSSFPLEASGFVVSLSSTSRGLSTASGGGFLRRGVGTAVACLAILVSISSCSIHGPAPSMTGSRPPSAIHAYGFASLGSPKVRVQPSTRSVSPDQEGLTNRFPPGNENDSGPMLIANDDPLDGTQSDMAITAAGSDCSLCSGGGSNNLQRVEIRRQGGGSPMLPHLRGSQTSGGLRKITTVRGEEKRWAPTEIRMNEFINKIQAANAGVRYNRRFFNPATSSATDNDDELWKSRVRRQRQPLPSKDKTTSLQAAVKLYGLRTRVGREDEEDLAM